MKLKLPSLVRSAAGYCARRPIETLQLVWHALGARVAVPLSALRWVVSQLPTGGGAPSDITIEARPPALHVGATVNAMETTVRAEISLSIDSVQLGAGQMRLAIGLADLSLDVIGDASSMVGGLLTSGALDLTKPGRLLKMMPEVPPAIVELGDRRLVIDLFAVPGVARNARLGNLLAAVTPVANVSWIRTEGDLLIIALRLTPSGLPTAIGALRRGLRASRLLPRAPSA